MAWREDPNGGVRVVGLCEIRITYAMRPLRNFKTNQCCPLISRIANRAFFLKVKEQTLSIFKPVKNEEVVQRVNKILIG